MKLKVFKSTWGMPGTLREQLARIAAAGYDGVETRVPEDVSEFKSMLADHDLMFIAQSFGEEAAALEKTWEQAIDLGAARIGCHGGLDCWNRDQGAGFFEAALKVQQRLGIDVAYETHRQRLFYSPWETYHYLQTFPELRIVADFSHWACVCEKLWEHRPEFDLACERTIHIHGRVGYAEGPQVPHPADPAYAAEVAWHEALWEAVKGFHADREDELLTFTPEFGPPGYMHVLPFTQEPVADLWDVCQWGADRIRKRWAELTAKA